MYILLFGSPVTMEPLLSFMIPTTVYWCDLPVIGDVIVMTEPVLSIFVKVPLATLLPTTTEYISLDDRKRPLSTPDDSFFSLAGRIPCMDRLRFSVPEVTVPDSTILGLTSTTPVVLMSRLTSRSVNFAGVSIWLLADDSANAAALRLAWHDDHLVQVQVAELLADARAEPVA